MIQKTTRFWEPIEHLEAAPRVRVPETERRTDETPKARGFAAFYLSKCLQFLCFFLQINNMMMLSPLDQIWNIETGPPYKFKC